MDIKNLLSVGKAAGGPVPSQNHNGSPPTSNIPGSPTSTSLPRRHDQPPYPRPTTSPRSYNRNLPPSLPPQAITHAQNTATPPLSASAQLASYRITPNNSVPSGDYRGSLLAPQANSPSGQQPRRVYNDRFDVPENVHRIRTSISHEVLRTPPISRHNSIAQLPLDLTQSPATPMRQYSAPSLSQAELDEISDLSKRLAGNDFLYDCHRRLINIFHNGFISHVLNPDTQHFQEPQSYSLLNELRQARQAMDSRIPVGEDLWVDWILDEIILAKTTEDRIAVMELCQKAVQDEAGSTRLWRIYGDWMWQLYKISHNLTGGYESSSLEQHKVVGHVLRSQSWSNDDKTVGAEVFTWNAMLDVWIQGVKATEWHINDSSTVWDPYVEILLHDLSRHPSADKVKHVWTFYAERLQKPHASWQDTFQGFSQFVTAHYDNSIYEDTMIAANQQSAKSKHEYEQRQDFEVRLQKAADEEDQNTEWMVMTEYLEWELAQSRRKTASLYGFELYVALLERANLRFPNATDWWEDHVDVITDSPESSQDILPLLHRATRHCPWSGNLWARYLLALEAESRPFEELEDVKHRATTTGLLEEIGGMDELIKVYTAWCGFLRRRALGPQAGEDETDVAEMGIRSVIENVKDIGARKYGKEFKGDPLFRAERIYLKFLPQTGRTNEARDTWNKLTATHGDLYDFWDKYYLWEMVLWGRESAKSSTAPPAMATRVLQQAIRRPNLDCPEKMLELYIHHCSQHESVPKLQEALTEARRIGKQVTKRREKEANEAARAQAVSQPSQSGETLPDEAAEVDDVHQQTKRKREDEAIPEGSAKRTRSEDTAEAQQVQTYEASSAATSQLKRDRENTTIVVKHLPVDTTEKRVRQFFRDCGPIISLSLIPNDKDDSQTAILEFESKEDVLAAQTKSMKLFDGQSIDIQIGSGTTLWVTNYPAEADEKYIRDLFADYGEIVEVRFPSLKYNTHRRFCYIQFITASQAYSATQLDGKVLAGNLQLNVKISDPTARKDREGAMHEGREVFIGGLANDVTEQDLRTLFGKAGNVQHVRIPRNMAGKSKCIAFVVLNTKEEAEVACELNQTELHGRTMKVEISRPNASGAKRSATSIIRSASPEAPGSAASPGSSSNNPASTSSKDHRERTILLRNVPDTVNDARIRAVAEKYGKLRKVTLKPIRNEAMVEYEDVASAGRAELGIQGEELNGGLKFQVGRIGESNQRTDQGQQTLGNGYRNHVSLSQPIKRPGQAGAPKRGGKTGLGFRSTGSSAQGSATSRTNGVQTTESKENGVAIEHMQGVNTATKDSSGGAKSNDDFRALITGGI